MARMSPAFLGDAPTIDPSLDFLPTTPEAGTPAAGSPLLGPAVAATPPGNPASPSLWSEFTDFLHNATYGTESDSQKAQLIQQEQASLVQAGMAPAQAQTKATSDVTNMLLVNNADPSQSSFFGSPGVQGLIPTIPGPSLGEIIAIGAAVSIGILLLGSVMRGRS